jgi:hypothetical protein
MPSPTRHDQPPRRPARLLVLGPLGELRAEDRRKLSTPGEQAGERGARLGRAPAMTDHTTAASRSSTADFNLLQFNCIYEYEPCQPQQRPSTEGSSRGPYQCFLVFVSASCPCVSCSSSGARWIYHSTVDRDRRRPRGDRGAHPEYASQVATPVRAAALRFVQNAPITWLPRAIEASTSSSVSRCTGSFSGLLRMRSARRLL